MILIYDLLKQTLTD